MSLIHGSQQRSIPGLVVVLYSFAVFSGIAALIYEVSWTKMLALTFGRTTLAVTAVVGGFMVGMGIGAWLYHKAAGSRIDAIKLYAALEFGIVLSTALLTPVLAALPEFFASLAVFVPAGLTMDLFRTAFVVVILLIPAALMGATFPALCSILIRSREGVSRHLGPIYGLNTVGAAIGAMIAGFVLMEWVGLQGSVRIANSINLIIGLLAWWLSTRATSGPLHGVTDLNDAEAIVPTKLPIRVTGVVLFASGFATLAYEIVWFRALRYLFGISTYAISMMLVVFLIGLGVGGTLAGRLRERHAPEQILGYSQLGIALLAMAAVGAEYMLLTSPDLWDRVSVYSFAGGNLGWQSRILLAGLIALAMMLPATLLMGLSFPVASQLFLGDVRRLGERVGMAYLLANLGSIIGAGTAAFFLLPYFGTIQGTLAIAFVNIVLGILVLARSSNTDYRQVAWAITPTVMLFVMWIALPVHLPFPTSTTNNPDMTLIWSEEGDVATVQVYALKNWPEQRGVFVDGANIGATQGFRPSLWGKQRLLAHLPMALAPGTKTSLNIGLGSSSTLQALASYQGVQRLDAVEISGSVVRASQGYFTESNVLKDPRVSLDVEDIAHFLLRGEAQYDLIISDGKVAEGFSGNELMLCWDFYEQAKRRLTADGIFVHWLPLAYPSDAFKVMFRTFLASFPETEVFLDNNTGLYIVGSRLPIGRARAERLDDGVVARADFARFNILNMSALMSRWLVSGQQLRRVLGEGQINTWDHSTSEFALSRADLQSLTEAGSQNLAFLLEAKAHATTHPYLPSESPFVQSGNLLFLSALAASRNDFPEAFRLVNEAVQANPADPALQLLLQSMKQIASQRR
jgi:spermidine synthase